MAPPNVDLTPQQDDAIHTRGESIAVSAGAGCGKTFVLTERYLAELDPRTLPLKNRPELRELVAITFTDRAAREMRDRVRKKTLERLERAVNDPKLSHEVDAWWKLLRELDSARISTIHSFCGTLLRSHAVEAELDPHFTLLDANQSATILSELTDDLLRKWLGEEGPLLIDLILRIGLDGVRGVLDAFRKSGSASDWETWRTRSVDEMLDIWTAFHRERIVPRIFQEITESDAAADVCEILGQSPTTNARMMERAATLLDLLPNLKRSRQLDVDLRKIREAATVQYATSKKDWTNAEIYERFKNAAAALRELIDKRITLLTFDREPARASAAAGKYLLSLAEEIREEYARRKKELNLLDFDDLIARTHRLLTDPNRTKFRQRIASQIGLLLVDEFQDTDPVQVELVRALCGDQLADGKLFFVGDKKQSIYRFRGAKPRVFRELREELKPSGRLPLTLNFRSQPGVLEFVNALFVERFAPDYEKLDAHRKQQSPAPSVEFWWSVPAFSQREKGISSPTELARRHEADQIARKLRSLFDESKPLLPIEKETSLRPVRYGDVAILFRALSDVQYYEQALQAYEIPYYLVGGRAFYSQQEIYDVLNLLRAIDCVADEVSLAGVLRSPFFSLDDESLFWLADHPEGLAAALYSAARSEHSTPAQRERIAFAAATIEELRRLKDRVPIADLLQTAIARTGYDAALLAEFLGERKLANLRKLIEQARSFDRLSLFTLSDFIVQLSECVVEQPHEALAATHPESADVVRLMTIHQAKGLEFPLVVVPDIERRSGGRSASAVFDSELGPLVKIGGDENNDDAPEAAVGLDLFRVFEKLDDEEESDRLFYVATTRAADRLILSSSFWDMEKHSSRWTELLSERFDLSTGECRATLPADYPTPKADVTLQKADATPPTLSRRKSVDWDQFADRAEHLAKRGQGLIPAQAEPIPPHRAARRQYSFSRLSGLLEPSPDEYSDAIPPTRSVVASDAPRKGTIDPLRLGTLVHTAIAEMRFDGREEVSALVGRHAALERIDDPATLAEATRMLESFARTDRAKQIAAAVERHSELEFLLAWPPDAPIENGPFLQGYLDGLYRDVAGDWHLLDFKTNLVSAETLAAEAIQYRPQLGVYALAIETILKRPPATLTLCFLRAGLEYEFAWTPASRRETIDWVSAAMAKA